MLDTHQRIDQAIAAFARGEIVVVTDDVVVDAELVRLLRRLRAQHEVVWVTVGGHRAELHELEQFVDAAPAL